MKWFLGWVLGGSCDSDGCLLWFVVTDGERRAGSLMKIRGEFSVCSDGFDWFEGVVGAAG